MNPSRNHNTETVFTSQRILNEESKDPKEDISDKKEDNKENKLEEKDIEEVSSDKYYESEFYQNEMIPLLKSKKVKLQDKFKSLYDKFEKFEDIPIYNIIDIYSNEDNENSSTEGAKKNDQGNLEKEKEEKRIYLEKIKCGVYTCAFFFFGFYLVGIFQLLDLFDSTKKITGIIFKSFFYNKPKENNETFKDLYMNSCFKNIPEFDFAFVTSFLGSLPLNLFGFFFSSLLFTILNSFLFANFMKLDLEKEKYDFFDLFHVSIYFLIFFISFGAESLFAHEKVSEGIRYYKEQKDLYTDKKENKNDEPKKKENNEGQRVKDAKGKDIEIKKKEKKVKKDKSKLNYEINYHLFFIISLGIIFAYIINKAANYLFYYKASKFYNKNFEYVFLIIYGGSYLCSLAFYFGFIYRIMVVKEIENNKEEEEKIRSGFYRICGFLAYYEKFPKDNRTDEDKNKEKQNEEAKTNNDLNLTQKIKNSRCDICCSVIIPCYKDCKKENKYKRFYCASCKLGCRKFYSYSEENELGIITICTCCLCNKWCCKACEKCCCDCCGVLDKLKESYEEEEIFGYIYQTQRKCSWFCDLFFENNIISLIIHNISIELGIIGFEKKLNEDLESRTINDNIKKIGAYFGNVIFFAFIFIIGYSFRCFNSIKVKTYTFYSIFLYIFYGVDITLSGFSLFAKNKLESITNNWLILLPLAYTKYINFLVLDKLVSLLDEQSIDILSNSIIMTSVFFIYDIIVFLISDLLDCSSDFLIFFQFTIGFIILFLQTIGLIISKRNKENKKNKENKN